MCQPKTVEKVFYSGTLTVSTKFGFGCSFWLKWLIPIEHDLSNLSIPKILVVTSAYVRTDSGGGGGKSQGNPTGGGECHLFLAGNRAVLVGNRVFLGGKSHDHRRF